MRFDEARRILQSMSVGETKIIERPNNESMGAIMLMGRSMGRDARARLIGRNRWEIWLGGSFTSRFLVR